MSRLGESGRRCKAIVQGLIPPPISLTIISTCELTPRLARARHGRRRRIDGKQVPPLAAGGWGHPKPGWCRCRKNLLQAECSWPGGRENRFYRPSTAASNQQDALADACQHRATHQRCLQPVGLADCCTASRACTLSSSVSHWSSACAFIQIALNVCAVHCDNCEIRL